MQPLLARPAAQVSCGTWLLTWGNLVTNVVGAGFLALPQCVSSMSELTGNGSALSWTILLLAVLGTMNMVSFWFLARSCEYCKALQPNIDRIDYLSMTELSLQLAAWPEWLRWVASKAGAVVCFLYPLCTLISYVVITRQVLFEEHGLLPLHKPDFSERRYLMLVGLVVLLVCLSWALYELWAENGRPRPLYTVLCALTALTLIGVYGSNALNGFFGEVQHLLTDLKEYLPEWLQLASDSPQELKTAHQSLQQSAVVFLLYLPMSCQREILGLGWASVFGVIAMVMVTASLYAADAGTTTTTATAAALTMMATPDIATITTTTATTTTATWAALLQLLNNVCATILVSFTAHYNAAQHYSSLGRDNHLEAFGWILSFSFIFVVLLYGGCAWLAHGLFGSDIKGDILKNLPPDTTLTRVTQVAYIVLLWADFPKVFCGFRKQFLQFLNVQVQHISTLLFWTVLGTFLAIELQPHTLPKVLQLKGSLFGYLMVYFFPAIIFLGLNPRPNDLEHAFAWILLICGGLGAAYSWYTYLSGS